MFSLTYPWRVKEALLVISQVYRNDILRGICDIYRIKNPENKNTYHYTKSFMQVYKISITFYFYFQQSPIIRKHFILVLSTHKPPLPTYFLKCNTNVNDRALRKFTWFLLFDQKYDVSLNYLTDASNQDAPMKQE